MVKRLYRVSLVLALVAAAIVLAAGSAAAGERPRVAVIEFEWEAGDEWWHWWRHERGAGAVQEYMMIELVKSGKFDMIDREVIDKIIQEQNLQDSGRVDSATAVRLGKLLGVEYMITGAVVKYGSKSVGGSSGGIGRLPSLGFKKNTFTGAISARMIEVETGRILWADDAEGQVKTGKLRVRGIGGGSSNNAPFDKLMKPLIEELCMSLKAADID